MCSYLYNASKNAITHHKRKHNDNNNKSKRARVSVGRLVDPPQSLQRAQKDRLSETDRDRRGTHPPVEPLRELHEEVAAERRADARRVRQLRRLADELLERDAQLGARDA